MLLALDTATQTASLAAFDLESYMLLAEWTWQARRRQTQNLLTAAQTMLKQIDHTPQQITALAVTTGPGSFTGVRIAISTVKGMSIGLTEPPKIIGIPTLMVSAAPWITAAATQSIPPCVCAFLQAGRGRFNWLFCDANFDANEAALLRRPDAADHGAGTVAEFTTMLAAQPRQPIWLTGETTQELADSVERLENVHLIDKVSSTRRAGQLARLAAKHLHVGTSDDPHALQPLYLRNP